MTDIRFDAGAMTFILSAVPGAPPQCCYWGKRLSAQVTAADVALLTTRQGAHGSETVPIAASLALEPGLGLMAPPGLCAHRDGQDWASVLRVESAVQEGHRATLCCGDATMRIGLTYEFACDPLSGVLTIRAALTNRGGEWLALDAMATACLPVPATMTDIIGFSGRWSDEFRPTRLARFPGGYVRENRRGRTSQDSFPALILCSRDTREQAGEAYGLHLAWSGNHRLRVDTLSDGRVFAALGALALPGEIRLAPGARYDSPPIVAAYSATGLSALSRAFHDHVRGTLIRPAVRARPRPVHYNSWEAVYFAHDLARLKALADKAAAVGVERFVLDDGWFGGRRHDRAGLGDWTVSDAVYPDGLAPLIEHVTGLGMEMGLWFEPEMVNPDSDLYRAHPEWVLRANGVNQVQFRNQYVLDIARPEVADYLFAKIDAILGAHAIGYIKWDMNRDLNHPGGPDGRPRALAQVSALYALIDRLRDAHPHVEIESCSSGGARADMGILAHTDRIWTSDTNDALDRQEIQRGASMFLPLMLLGAHVGPSTCHITGRTLTMAMRAGTAMMGHMGVELDLLDESAANLAELARAIALYKRMRPLLHEGDHYRLDTPGFLNAHGVVAADKQAALFSLAWLGGHAATLPPRLALDGLAPERDYRIRLVWPEPWRSVTAPGIMEALELGGRGLVVRGEALMTIGLQLPLALPQTVLLFHLEAD